jgi:nitroreductase
MKISEAVLSRRSVRAFSDQPVPADVLRRVTELAARAPSGGNLQPWHVDIVAGEKLAELKAIVRQRIMEAPSPQGEGAEYDIYPPSLGEPYRTYRYQLGEAMYARLGIPREDKQARACWFARNFEFFGAPAALFMSVDRQMGPPQWSDMGMYLQTFMLLLREQGLHSCPQECWALYAPTISSFLGLPAERMLFCGMSIGYAAEDDALSDFRAERAPLEAFARFHGL